MNETIDTTPEATTKTVLMSHPALDQFQTKINRLNRRAQRLGVAPVSVSVGSFADHEFEDGRVVKVAPVTVSLTIPVRPGWQFAATLEHKATANVLRIAPGFTTPLPEKFRTCGSFCDHCRTQRSRKDTFVLQHENGHMMQIGRDCLLSYLPLGVTPESLADFAEWVSEMVELASTEDEDLHVGEHSEGFGGGRDDRFSLEKFMAFVTASARLRGFRTRKQAEIDDCASTRVDAIYSMFPPNNLTSEERAALLHPTDEEIEHGKAVIEWAKSIEPRSDFDHNIRVIAGEDYIEGRDAGLAAYLYQAHQNHLGLVAKRKLENASKPESHHVGEIGKRLRKETLVYIGTPYSGDTPYGWVFIHKFSTTDGSDLVWKTGTSLDDLNPGDTITADFTPKEHGEFRDRKQTKITRVKIHSVQPAEEKNEG